MTNESNVTRLVNYINQWIEANPDFNWGSLARKAGISESTASVWKQGRIKNRPRPETLQSLAEVMHVPFDKIMGIAGYNLENAESSARTEEVEKIEPREKHLIECFRDLPEQHKQIAYDMIKKMSDASTS